MSRPQGRGFVTVTVPANVRTETSVGILLNRRALGAGGPCRRSLPLSASDDGNIEASDCASVSSSLHTRCCVFHFSWRARFPPCSPKLFLWAPQGFPQQTCVPGGRAGWAADMCPGHASGCFSAPAQAPVAVQVGLACLQPAHGFTALGPRKDLSLFVSHGTLCILQQSFRLWLPVYCPLQPGETRNITTGQPGLLLGLLAPSAEHFVLPPSWLFHEKEEAGWHIKPV